MFVVGGALALSGCASPVAEGLLEGRSQERRLGVGEVSVRWLGTAGFEVRNARTVAVLDPYLTRSPLVEIGLSRLTPDEEVLQRALPRADVVLVGHSHFDHALDAPSLAARTGALLVGTETTCHLAHRLAPEAGCRWVRGDERLSVGAFSLTPVASRHVELPWLGIPLDGVLKAAPRSTQAPHALEMPMGGALAWVMRVEGLVLVHLSSSSLPKESAWLRHAVPEGADVVLASAAQWERSERYPERIVEELSPRLVIPHHFESFWVPLVEQLSADDREQGETFAARIEELGVKAHVPVPFEELVLSDASLPPRGSRKPATTTTTTTTP